MAERVFRLYDTMSKRVKELHTSEPGVLKFYTCGPTVYSYAHIGNFRSFLGADLVVRTCKALGWKVVWVTNITDVGHLTQDDVADAEGEDRMEKALKSKEGEQFANVWDLAEYYANCYQEDWMRLNLSEPTVRPRATQHVREQIAMTQALIASGHAYETPTGVYFDVNSDPNYGRLSGNTRDKLLEGVRDVVLDDNKRQQADFALWKKDDKHLMQWFSPWGWGFPGWHIECSAMARSYLGDTLDLHSGGEDNMFPHHECEIAQSENFTGKVFSNHWMHVRFLRVEGEKMAKSAGNFYTVRDLVAKGFDPLAIRFALISVPYGKPFNFTLQGLKDAQSHIEKFRENLNWVNGLQPSSSRISPLGEELERIYDAALEAMCEDLNTSIAIAKALEGSRLISRNQQDPSSQSDAAWFLDSINDLLGIVLNEQLNVKPVSVDPPGEPIIEGKTISAWIQERTEAKSRKDFKTSDEIRAKIDEAGYELRDSVEGTRWVKKRG